MEASDRKYRDIEDATYTASLGFCAQVLIAVRLHRPSGEGMGPEIGLAQAHLADDPFNMLLRSDLVGMDLKAG